MRRFAVAALLWLAWAGAALAQDFSGTITLGGTSQVAIAAQPAGQDVFIQNSILETETLFVNFGAAAAAGNSVALTPGGSISVRTTQSVNVLASDSTHVFIAKRIVVPVNVSNSTGSGGAGGGDATAANQATQITHEANTATATQFLAALNYTPPASGGVTSVSDDDTPAQTCLASNVNRQGAYFFNNSPSIAYLLVDEGTASTSNFTVRMDPYSGFNVPMTTSGAYTDAISCIWASDLSGAMLVTEWSP